MRVYGLSIGGPIFRHHVAKTFCWTMLSFHHPNRMCWSWLIEAYRYRRESQCAHGFLRVTRIPGHQARTIIDLFWLLSVQFVKQQRTPADRRHDNRREMFRNWVKGTSSGSR